MSDPLPLEVASLRWRLPDALYGALEPPLDDPAETYHEASKLSPASSVTPVGAALLEASASFREVVSRPVRSHPHRPQYDLPRPEDLRRPLGTVLEARRSARRFSRAPLASSALATILHASYGATTEHAARAVPSAGGLYPLEVYAAIERVDGLPRGLYHHDASSNLLAQLEPSSVARALRGAFVHPELAVAPVILIVTALFQRCRFKYGLRGYRFCLLEAGHLAQNALLACAALDLAAVPIGGFFDRCLERILHVDGVEEAPLYCLAIGLPEE